ncbi:centrosomal protein of 72 kDa-like [Mytilus edulis]|uniref:centrosomal protein of 72 kDa-like n=1 Tax=Mytilus edulis TaxID=6550 RepID=UPI0039EF85D3
MALTLTEEIIRNRVNLQHDNLEDVKALSLPGTYHEKVVELGSSFRKFSRLKSLDLSRNTITCLKGIEHLKLLEKLNLYYNSIESFEELKRLRFNTNLKELDLRLNPVTRTEADYRLYLIHMLPNLQKLDDRGVRDRERQAALVHFSSSQATEMTPHEEVIEPQHRQPNPRAQSVRGMGKGMTALDDDDVAVLDLIAHTGGDLSKPRHITGSTAREPSAEEYSLEVLKTMETVPEEAIEDYHQTRKQTADGPVAPHQKKYPNIPAGHTGSYDVDGTRRDENLQYQDEVDAYTKFKSHGYFTPHPENGRGDRSESPRVPTERRHGGEEEPNDHRRTKSVPSHKLNDSLEDFGMHRIEGDRLENGHRSLERPKSENEPVQGETPTYKDFLFKMCDLVDRYWNGTKSLHKNPKYKGFAYSLIQNLGKKFGDDSTREKRYVDEQLNRLEEENYRLRKQSNDTKATLADSTFNETQMRTQLRKAQTDVDQLKEHLKKIVTENRELQKKLNETGNEVSAVNSMSSVNQTHLDELQRQNDVLKNENQLLQIRLKQHGQLQDLASMLQDSHKSLVTTNDHLLKEFNDTKQRHNNEVQQLNWSYNQLKKSMNMLSSRNESSYLPSVSRDHGHNPGLSRSDQVLGCATLYDGRET